jgi:phage-related protein
MPLMLLIGVLGAVVKGISWLSKVAGRSFWYIKQVWDLTTEAIELAWTKISRKLQELWDQFVNWFNDTCEKIKNFFISAWDSVNNAIMETGEFIQKYVIDPIMTAINWLLKLKGSAGNYIDQIGQGASDAIDTVKGILGFGGDENKPLPGAVNTPQGQTVNTTNNNDVTTTVNIYNPQDSGKSAADVVNRQLLQNIVNGQYSKG